MVYRLKEEQTVRDKGNLDREDKYYDYLKGHIGNVQKSWFEILRPYVVENNAMLDDELMNIDRQMSAHDTSKYSEEEFVPYLNHFYPEDGSKVDESKDDPQFDAAWLHHIHSNPHHWQHWLLRRDSGETVALPMRYVDILEMLCDWHSFSAKNPESTAYKWYYDNKDKMMFNSESQEVVEELVEVFKDNPLK